MNKKIKFRAWNKKSNKFIKDVILMDDGTIYASWRDSEDGISSNEDIVIIKYIEVIGDIFEGIKKC